MRELLLGSVESRVEGVLGQFFDGYVIGDLKEEALRRWEESLDLGFESDPLDVLYRLTIDLVVEYRHLQLGGVGGVSLLGLGTGVGV